MTKITVDKDLIEQALDALASAYINNPTLAKLIAALAEPAVEPVASIYITPDGQREVDDWNVPLPVGRNELYTSPPPPAEVPLLTDEEMMEMVTANAGYGGTNFDRVARAIEQAVRQKAGLA